MVWTPHQVITRLRPRRHTVNTPRRPADQLDTSPLWFWDDEPRTTARTDTPTLPIIIDQDGDPYPPVEREPHTRSHRTGLQHTPTVPGVSATNPYLAAHPGGGPGGGSLPGTGTTAGGGSSSVFGAGPRGGPKTGGHHGHPKPGGGQPGPGPCAAPTPP